MEQSFIENIERRRYRLMFWQTVSFGAWFSMMLLIFVISDPSLLPLRNYYIVGGITLVMLAGATVFGIVCYRLGKVTKQIVSDPKLRSAVNNELYIANDRRAGVWGYYITLFAVVIMFVFASFTDIPGKIVAGVLLLVAALSAKVAQLILHR